MAAGQTVIELIDQLITLFNARSMDLPDGLFTRHSQFLLNGVPFEEMLGRSPSDPLVLMIARGPAGYRFTAKAIQHAIPDAKLVRGELHQADDGDVQTVTGQCWLSGHYRGDGEPVEILIDVQLRMKGTTLQRANVALDTTLVQRLHEARMRQ